MSLFLASGEAAPNVEEFSDHERLPPELRREPRQFDVRRIAVAGVVSVVVLATVLVFNRGQQSPASSMGLRTVLFEETGDVSVNQYNERIASALALLAKVSYCDGRPGMYSSVSYSCGGRTGLPTANRTACDEVGIAVVPGSVQPVQRQGTFAYTARVQKVGLYGLEKEREAFLIVFRGSIDDEEDRQRDAMHTLSPFYGVKDICPDARVHAGFHLSWEALKRPILRQLDALQGKNSKVICTGHGSGAAICALAAYELKKLGYTVLSTAVFNMPRVGNAAFATCFERAFGQSTFFRVTHAADLSCGVPQRGPGLDYTHVGTEVYYPGESTGDYRVCSNSEPTCGCMQYGEAQWNGNATCTSALAPEGSFCAFGSFPATCYLGTGFHWSAFGPSLGSTAGPAVLGVTVPLPEKAAPSSSAGTTTPAESLQSSGLRSGSVPPGWW